MTENKVLCAASAYTKQFYLNPAFQGLPEDIREELNVICVLFTEDVGGILVMEFEEDGSLNLKTSADEQDLLYDEIGAVLKVKQLRQRQGELLESLELYYRIFYLDETSHSFS